MSAEAHFLEVTLGGHQYGLLAADVREILRAVSVVPLPSAPAVVEGVIDVRGQLVPVLDIRSRFQLGGRAVAVTDHFVLCQIDARTVAIRVDEARGFRTVAAESVTDVRGPVPGAAYVSGVARLESGLVLIHDLRTFLGEAEAVAKDASLRSASSFESASRTVLDDRARRLATATTRTDHADTIELLTFAVNGARYGIETGFAIEVLRATTPARVPGTPPWWVGVVNLHGEILAVADLCPLVGSGRRNSTELVPVLVLGGDRAEFGIAVDRVESATRVDPTEILALPGERSGAGVLRGVMRDGLLILDGTRLLSDPRLFLDQGSGNGDEPHRRDQ